MKLAFGGRVRTEVTVDQFKDVQPPRLLLRELWVRFDFKELLRVTLRSGGLGWVERLLTKILLQRIYKAELKQLARVCEGASGLGVKPS